MSENTKFNAAILIIGNEILSGRTQDSNTSTLATWLNSIGVKVLEVRVIQDDENTIVETLKFYKIESFPDKNNIGIWYKDKNELKKIAAIGIRVSKWIAYHGFAINIDNDLENYKKIIPCGITDKGVTNLKSIIDQDYSNLSDKLIKNFISNLKM